MKPKIMIPAMLLCALLTSCSQDAPAANDDSCTFDTFQSEEQLYAYLQEEVARHPDSTFAQNVGRDQVIPLYTMEVPEGYVLTSIDTTNYSAYISMHYRDDKDSTRQITYVWGYNTLGDKYLNEAVEMIGLTAIPGMEDYYYIGAADDSGTQIYQIYWSEDGYQMQANVPVEVFGRIGDTLSDERSGAVSHMPLSLRRQEIPIA